MLSVRKSDTVNDQHAIDSEAGLPVSEGCGLCGNEFTGEINWVQIAFSADATVEEYSITGEERLLVAMAMEEHEKADRFSDASPTSRETAVNMILFSLNER